jgi:hypothetical protein
LLGYTRAAVAKPYQVLGLSLTVVMFAAALAVVSMLRNFYSEKISTLFDGATIGSSLLFTFSTGLAILFLIVLINALWIRKKVNATAH